MSASTQKQMAEKTQAQILKKVGKRPKSTALIAVQVGVSSGAVRRHLNAFAKKGLVVQEKQGREFVFRLAESPTAPKAEVEWKRASATQVAQ